MSDSKPETGAELLEFMDKCAATFNEYESEKIQDPDVAKIIQDMRRLKGLSLDSLHALQAFIDAMNTRMKGFAELTEQFEDHISRKALNYGLSLIPDDALLEIFTFAAESLEEKVGLSLVCRRFRKVMMSTRKMWDGHCLESRQTPEQMVAIAEGNRFDSLKATICDRRWASSSGNFDWTRKQAQVPEEVVDRFYKHSLDFILPLHLEELQIYDLADEETDQRILDSVAMQSVRTLMMRNSGNPVLRSFERRHTPSLRTLDVNFVPGPTVGRGLIGCKLFNVIADQLDSLREFLASANSLQSLLLHISDDWRFYEACDLPSLRSLAVNFTPHLSFVRHLTRFSFLWSSGPTLTELLDLLSSIEVLQALLISRNGGIYDGGTPDASSLQVVTLPYLASFKIHQGFFRVGHPLLLHTLSTRLRMPVLRRLELRFSLGSEGFYDAIEAFDDHPPDIVSVPQGRLVHISDLWNATPKFIHTLAGYFTSIEGMQIEFDECRGWTNGTLGLDELDSDFMPDSSESESD